MSRSGFIFEQESLNALALKEEGRKALILNLAKHMVLGEQLIAL